MPLRACVGCAGGRSGSGLRSRVARSSVSARSSAAMRACSRWYSGSPLRSDSTELPVCWLTSSRNSRCASSLACSSRSRCSSRSASCARAVASSAARCASRSASDGEATGDACREYSSVFCACSACSSAVVCRLCASRASSSWRAVSAACALASAAACRASCSSACRWSSDMSAAPAAASAWRTASASSRAASASCRAASASSRASSAACRAASSSCCAWSARCCAASASARAASTSVRTTSAACLATSASSLAALASSRAERASSCARSSSARSCSSSERACAASRRAPATAASRSNRRPREGVGDSGSGTPRTGVRIGTSLMRGPRRDVGEANASPVSFGERLRLGVLAATLRLVRMSRVRWSIWPLSSVRVERMASTSCSAASRWRCRAPISGSSPGSGVAGSGGRGAGSLDARRARSSSSSRRYLSSRALSSITVCRRAEVTTILQRRPNLSVESVSPACCEPRCSVHTTATRASPPSDVWSSRVSFESR